MPRPIQALIDCAAMSDNLARVREHVRSFPDQGGEKTLIWAVIKANAYGHGIEVAVDAFAQADGLAMLDFTEAVRCRKAGWRRPILMLEGFFDEQDLLECAQWDLWPVIHEPGQLQSLERTVLEKPVHVFLKLDSGMHRLGFEPGAYRQAYSRLKALQAQNRIATIGHMTHFASADEEAGIVTAVRTYASCVDGLPGNHSLANSAGIFRHGKDVTYGASWQTAPSPTWVRPGICLYGASPFLDLSAHDLGLRPAMTLASRVLDVRSVESGQGIGYGYQYYASEAMRVAVVACGYADGYPRHAPNGTPVVVNGQRVPLAGRVSMDMLTVDVTSLDDVKAGDQVILWGQGGPSVDEVAQASGTIGYELLTGVTARVIRNVIKCQS